MDKSKIKEFFSRAATTYDLNAFPQRRWGERLLSAISSKDGFLRILDIGMGTGSLTIELARVFPASQIFGCDIATGMVAYAQNMAKSEGFDSIDFREADFEDLPYPDGFFNLLFSNVAFQWALNIECALREVARVLKRGGQLYFTTLGPNSLQELKELLSKTGMVCPSEHNFLERDSLAHLMKKTDWREFNIDIHEEKIAFENIFSFLKWLKATGANNGLELNLDGLAMGKYILKLKKLYPRIFFATFEVLFVSCKRR